jgi:hypothetical protein
MAEEVGNLDPDPTGQPTSAVPNWAASCAETVIC